MPEDTHELEGLLNRLPRHKHRKLVIEKMSYAMSGGGKVSNPEALESWAMLPGALSVMPPPADMS